jgi:hypothetical protein
MQADAPFKNEGHMNILNPMKIRFLQAGIAAPSHRHLHTPTTKFSFPAP